MESIKIDDLLNSIESKVSLKGTYSLADILKMVTIGITAGASSLLQVCSTWNDKVLTDIARIESIPDDSTVGRILKKVNLQSISDFEEIQANIAENVKEQYLSPIIMNSNNTKEKMFDIDGTPMVSFGNQEGSVKGYNHYKKGAKCFQSLIAFDTQMKTVSLAWLQSGNTHCVNGAEEFVKQIKAIYPNQKLFFRFDSGFFSQWLIKQLELLKCGYLIKTKLQGMQKVFNELVWNKTEGKEGLEGWEGAQFKHKAKDWDKERNFYAVRIKTEEIVYKDGLFPDHVCDKYSYFCYVTSKSDVTPMAIHKLYNKRAVCENYIEELKNQMNLGKIKSNDFNATSMLFHCSILAYNITRWMTISTGNKRLFKWEMSTIRCFLVRVAGRLRFPGKQRVLDISKGHLFQNEVNSWFSFCMT